MDNKKRWSTLKTLRDELRVKSHLFNMDVKEKWGELDKEFNKLNDKIERSAEAVGDMSEEIWEGHKLIIDELKDGFQKIKRVIKS